MASDTIPRDPPCDVSVIIAGAGVGGLMTALECWRRGCTVRVFERTKHNVTTGDSFTIGPTAIRAIERWPWMRQRNQEIAYHPMIAFHSHTGERLAGPIDLSEIVSENGGDASKHIYRHSRPKFHRMLLDQLGIIKIPVEYGNEVVEYFENTHAAKAGVVVRDGTTHEADLIVAADGVRGNSWPLIAGQPIPARSSGAAVFRVAYPVELALADPVVAERFQLQDDGRGVMEMWDGPGMHASFFRSEDQMMWGINHPDLGSAAESWSHKASVEEVLKFTATVPNWPEVADRVIKKTPADLLVDWKLMWRDPQPKWTSPEGRVVQLGDAAHTFLPSSGNGASQAIEDAVSLAACVSMAGCKGKVPDATRVHNLLRFERVSCLQAFGVKNAKKRSTAVHKKGAEDGAKKMTPRLSRWIVSHDPEKYVFENYEQALQHLKRGVPFQNTNIPPGITYKPWTIDGLLAAQERGEPTVLDGDWD